MLLSTTVCALMRKGRTWNEIVNICKTAGFDALDMGFHVPGWCEAETENPEFRQKLTDMRAVAEDHGLVFNQAHAPYYRKKKYIDNLEECTQNAIRSMKYAALLGAKIIVVHPLHYLTYREPGIPEKLFEMNMEYYNRLQKYCEEYGIRIAVENMWQSIPSGKIVRSTCSTPEEFCRYLDNLDKNCFTGCLDLGHAMLADEPVSFIQKAGKYISALHVHDNAGFNDDHNAPYAGNLDWASITKALGEVGYSGDFTYEAVGFQGEVPCELDQTANTALAQMGRYLINQIDAARV